MRASEIGTGLRVNRDVHGEAMRFGFSVVPEVRARAGSIRLIGLCLPVIYYLQGLNSNMLIYYIRLGMCFLKWPVILQFNEAANSCEIQSLC